MLDEDLRTLSRMTFAAPSLEGAVIDAIRTRASTRAALNAWQASLALAALAGSVATGVYVARAGHAPELFAASTLLAPASLLAER